MTEKAANQLGVSPSERCAIGISFGNSYSSIASTTDDSPVVIANEDGDRQIPTILSYVEGEEYTGNQAKALLVRNPKNTIVSFKDFLGQDFKSIDPTHCHAASHPQDVNGTVSFTVQDKAEEEGPSTISVKEVATRYLRRLLRSASDYLGKKVTSAVIAVPTNFTGAQREALIQAANDAELEVLQLINEPIASLLAYDARPEAKLEDKIVVVAELGGTRSDVAVVASRGGLYTILATAHDYEYSGSHLDNVLMEHFAKEFMKKHPNVDPRANARSLAKLKAESEAAKKALSIGNNASFSVESLAEGIDFQTTINRLRYETIARKVFEGFNRLVEGVIKKAGLDVLDIDEVILSGGTSHTPRIAANFRSIFPETTTIQAPSTSASAVNPSELQARGAALQASLIQEYESDDIDQSTHPGVTTVKHITNAIGVLSLSGEGEESFTPIIAPETAVPTRRTIHIAAPENGGDVLVKVVEGNTHIKVTKPEPKAKENGKKEDGEGDGDDDEEDDEDDDEEEEEETREKVWKIGSALAEAAIRGVKKGSKVEVTVNVSGDLAVTITTREVGGKGGIRGVLKAP
ncbi:HSP70-domain-containing protein [Durotheca rogersii]|uniref:HSP70-domain-containing protein n=1 Tax=Durotheca rogersii TaxID=419775 RepID=UPI00221EEC7D|nr:HSP70-domain-containing protein [Durotheca rogersii]KAI5867664.1 HSP70-domain-containing protein [Durotheca rogersii]